MADPGCEILFLVGHLNAGNQARDLARLVDRLQERGHQTRVLCVRSTGGTELAEVTPCPGLDRRWRRPWAARGLRHVLGEKPDRPRLLHVREMSLAAAGLELAERWEFPYLVSVEDYPSRDVRFRLSRAWSRGFIAANAELAFALQRDYQIPPSWVHTVPRGIADGPVDPPARPPGRVPVVGAAGPLVQGSGFSTFLSAARRVIDAGLDVEFLIVGEGEDEFELRRRADRLRLTDRVTLAADRNGPFGWWNVVDVFCQTSVTSTVGYPLSLALAYGVSSVATDVEGLRTLIESDRNGIQVPPGDPGALARAILGLLGDPDRARSLAAAGKRTADQVHDPVAEADRLDALYRRLTFEANPQTLAPQVVALNPWRAPRRIDAGAPIGSRPVPRPPSRSARFIS